MWRLTPSELILKPEPGTINKEQACVPPSMTRSRKHKHNRHQSEITDQPAAETSSDTSTSKDTSYPPPPGPPPEVSTAADDADVVDLHPQTAQASFLRLISRSPEQTALPEPQADPGEHFVDVPECSACSDPLPAQHTDLPISHGARTLSATQPQSSAAETTQPALPRLAVHTGAGQTSTLQQSFTISAGPRPQQLHYLWSPNSKQQDAAIGLGPSYMEPFDDGKKKLLHQGSSPFADVTKQQVARMATWEPDPKVSSHSRMHIRPWWVRLFSPWHKDGEGDAEAVDGGDTQHDKGAELAVPSWRWKLVVFLCCLVAMICYVDRAAMSVAIIPMSLQYGWSNSVKGAINRYMHLWHCGQRQMC